MMRFQVCGDRTLLETHACRGKCCRTGTVLLSPLRNTILILFGNASGTAEHLANAANCTCPALPMWLTSIALSMRMLLTMCHCYRHLAQPSAATFNYQGPRPLSTGMIGVWVHFWAWGFRTCVYGSSPKWVGPNRISKIPSSLLLGPPKWYP